MGRLALVAVIALGVVGCSTDEGASEAELATRDGCEGAVIGDSIPQASDPALDLIHEGLRHEAEELGMEVISADADLDVNQQISDVDSFIQRDASVLSIWPMDAVALQGALERAQDDGIPIIAQNTLADVPLTANLIFDDRQMGAQLADYLGEQLGEGAQVAAIFGPREVESFDNLATGFMEGAEEAGLDVVETQENPTLSAEAARSIAEQFRLRHGSDLDGIFDTLDATALATTSALDGEFDPLVVTYGGTAAVREAVQEGRVTATAYVPDIVLGRAKAWLACQALQGEELPRDVYFPFVVSDEDEIAALPDEDQQESATLEFDIVEVDGRSYISFEGLEFPGFPL